MKNKVQKIKHKIHEHRYDIAAVGVVIGLIALAAYGDQKVAEQQKKEAERRNKFIVEQNKLGRTVVQLADGQFIGVAFE